MSSSSGKHSRHTNTASHSSINSNSRFSSSSRSNSLINEEEEKETSKSDSNSAIDNSGDEGILTQIDSMPSLDSEFLMSPNTNFPDFSKNSNAGSDNDDTESNSKNEESKNGSNHFPSIMPDDLPIIDPSQVLSSNQDADNFSESYSDSNFIDQENSLDNDQKSENSSEKKGNERSKSVIIDIPAKKRNNSHIIQSKDTNKRNIINKSKIASLSKNVYTDDFGDDDGDPSSNLPMPMQMTSLPESTSKRRQTLPLKRSSYMKNSHKNLEKANSTNKFKFLGYEGMNECEPNLLKKCHNCSENIEEDGVFINGWYYHRKCLFCSKCGKSISQLHKCYMYQEQLMCDKCVHINPKEISICRVCGQKIFNESEKIDLENGQKVHKNCISCYICGKQLSIKNAQIIKEDDNDNNDNKKPKSKRDKDDDTDNKHSPNSKQKNKKKKDCKDRRTSNFSCDTLVTPEDGIKTTKFACKRCYSFLIKEQVCYTCGHPILENIVVKNQRVFHRQCFRCEHKGCQKQLYGNSYVVHHNQFLCWEHGKIYTSSCAYCKQLFKSYETDLIKWHSKMYHKVCFVCRICGCSLDPQSCKSIHGRPHCDKCFQIRVDEGDCDEKGRSLYIHYNQMHHKKQRRKKKEDSYSTDPDSMKNKNTAEEEEDAEEEEESSNYSFTNVNLNENMKKKHDTHLHVAKQALFRKSRFQKKYNVDVYWPEYCEKVFEKAEPYKPEEDKNVFKKF